MPMVTVECNDLHMSAYGGGDGRSHQVPVYLDEYISVTGQGSIRIREDIDFEDSAISQRERLDHINTVLDSANLNIYRRHIAPKV